MLSYSVFLMIALLCGFSTSLGQKCSLCSTDESQKHDCNYPNHIVECHNGSYVTVLPCYCMFNATVGYCFYTCFNKDFFVAENTNNWVQLCDSFNRTGRFCGSCKKDTAFPVYSFSLRCVECNANWKNVAKYIALAYGPMTLFLIIIVVFRVSINSAPLLGFIFVAQISTSPFQMRLAKGVFDQLNSFQKFGINICASMYGIWNLDFLRFTFDPFCLHPSLSTIHVISLDYIIASYPCILILVTYGMAEFHARGYRLFIILWKPFHYCFARFRHQLNIKTSMADAFGTFFSLSYAKTLTTTIDLVSFTRVWNSDGTIISHQVYYDASRRPLSDEHVPFLLLALLFFSVFNVIPIFVLFVYSFKQQYLPTEERHFFYPLMNTLLASYKDGRGHGCNCRFFVVVYLIARIIVYAAIMFTLNYFFQLLAALLLLVLGMLVAVIKPYKSTVYNTTDTVLLLSLALSYLGVASYYYAFYISPMSLHITEYAPGILFVVPSSYIAVLVLYNAWVVNKLPQRTVKEVHTQAVKLMQSIKSMIHRLNVEYLTREEYHSAIIIPPSTVVTIDSRSLTM